MKRIDELIKKETKLEKKKESLLAELENIDRELTAVRKLRVDAEKIMSRMEAEQKKLDDLLHGQVSQRGRKKQKEEPDEQEAKAEEPAADSDSLFTLDPYEERE